MSNMMSVSSLNTKIKSLLEATFMHILVEGEVASVTYHTSGHVYFSVKDKESSIKCVMWRSAVSKLKFRIEKGMHIWWGVSAISLILGTIMMLFTAWIFFMLLKLQSSGTMKIDNALGKEAEVYLTIPAKKNGTGKVQIIIQGSYRTLDAVTEDIEDIKTGSFVEIVEVVNDTLVVRRKR